MKILHISSAKTWRGGEQQIAYLVEELQKLKIAQHIFCAKDSSIEAWCVAQGIEYTTYLKASSISPFTAKKLADTINKQNCQILHAHDSHAHTYACIAMRLFACKVPIVLHRRVDFLIKKSPLSKWKYNDIAIAKIICVSAAIQRILATSIRDKTKLNVVHSGIDKSRFQFESTEVLRKEFGVPNSHLLIGNVAAIAAHKDYFTFVDTVEILVREGLNATFFIIGGDGGEKAAIQEHITKKSLKDYIFFTDFRTDIPRILPELDVFLFTSKEEGLGTSVLDAFAAKVPVVATNAGGIPEMVQHEKTGLLAKVGDAKQLAKNVKRIVKQHDLAKQLTQNASARLEDFTKQKMASQILEIYQEIMSDLRL